LLVMMAWAFDPWKANADTPSARSPLRSAPAKLCMGIAVLGMANRPPAAAPAGMVLSIALTT
jgi:hypothetical protein